MAVQKSNCTADEGPEVLNPFTAMMSLENGKKEKEKKIANFKTLKPFCLFFFFFTLACERIFIKTQH